jgi:type IV pilus assembly protein PilB
MLLLEETTAPAKEATAVLFGDFLVSQGLITQEQLRDALGYQREGGGRLGQVLVKLKMLSDSQITSALAEHLAIERFVFDDISKIDMNVARMLPEAMAKKFCIAAVGEEAGEIVLAMADPLNVMAIDTISLKIKRQIKVVISSTAEIKRAIDVIYHGSDVEEQKLRDLIELEVGPEPGGKDLFVEDLLDEDISGEEAATKAPVIRFVDLLLSQAAKSRASDIHIEPQENSMTIRMRIDGLLREMVPPPKKMQPAVTARVKILAKADIAERRLPQDGRFQFKAAGRDIDVRVSIIPTIYGEKVVMRILDASAVDHNLDRLGFDADLLDEFKSILAQPHGIIIVTGPTGSGKSTTLYSVLNHLKDPQKNITTVEDPVEYRLEGINQIQVKPEIELNFASCLRAILRQDPDIILIGEIRDRETVDIAIKASLTGHLVLSTFHTNDAPSAISRLVYMGVDQYLLASTLNLVVAQRLVRKVCEHCGRKATYSLEVLSRLGITPERAAEARFHEGRGCKNCGGTGYLGRLPVFEFLVIDDAMREAVIEGAHQVDITKLSRERGYGGLLESGAQKVIEGLTTPEEVLRVTYSQKLAGRRKTDE